MMYMHRLFATLALACFAALPLCAHAQLADKKALTLDAAKKMAAAAEAEAVKNKFLAAPLTSEQIKEMVQIPPR